jgi:hypothetical protein
MKVITKAFVALMTATLTPVDSFAGDCSFLGRDPLTLRDTELFFKLPQSEKWETFDETRPDGTWGNQKITFAYVIQEKLDQRRSGVVAVKSGRDRVATDPAPRVVELVRARPDNNDDNTAFDNGQCGPIPEFGRATVSAASYDRYHDLGSNVSAHDQSVLDRFHYRYLGRHDRCRRTNDNTPDSKVPLVTRSNLGQFSFSEAIVGKATDSQIIALASPDAAYAGSSDKFAEQRVEIKAYRVTKGLPTCVVFMLTVPQSTGFVRINDLEGLVRYNLYYIRSDEKSWPLTQ